MKSEIAPRFEESKLEFFSTFGGNPLSCAAALATLQVIEDENLGRQASKVGAYFHRKLLELKVILKEKADAKETVGCIGDVRGSGFFQGIELVENCTTHVPATKLTSLVVLKLLQRRPVGILSTIDGKSDNVLVFKPPMCFTRENATEFVTALKEILETIPPEDLRETDVTPT